MAVVTRCLSVLVLVALLVRAVVLLSGDVSGRDWFGAAFGLAFLGGLVWFVWPFRPTSD